MTNQEKIEFLKESHRELKRIEKNPDIDSVKKWKAKLLPKLDNTYKNRINKMEIVMQWYNDQIDQVDEYIDDHEFQVAETILRDTVFNYLNKKTKEDIEALKILKAREKNIEFEYDLALIICGDNEKFPYRSSSKLTEFFQNLGHNFIHASETRSTWVKEKLELLNVKEIHTLISTGIFRKKYFIDYSKEKQIVLSDFLKEAKIEFSEFIKNSITANEAFDLSSVLDMNVNIELLFDQKADTEDAVLNKLIEEGRERFLINDKQVALEKIWDAYERIKTYYSNEGLNKKQSATKLVNSLSDNFDKKFIDSEFKELTTIGNGYYIRHHEIGKKALTHEHRNYFFFRMLSLIDLCLVFLNKSEQEEVPIF